MSVDSHKSWNRQEEILPQCLCSQYVPENMQILAWWDWFQISGKQHYKKTFSVVSTQQMCYNEKNHKQIQLQNFVSIQAKSKIVPGSTKFNVKMHYHFEKLVTKGEFVA